MDFSYEIASTLLHRLLRYEFHAITDDNQEYDLTYSIEKYELRSKQYQHHHNKDKESNQKGETAPSSWRLLPGFPIRV